MNRIYLDHNATTAVDPAVLDAMLPYFSADFGNASSIHTFGQRARAAVETAREQVAGLLSARPQEIVFTSGGTESDNHAIFGVALEFLTSLNSSTSLTSPHIITTTIEHEAVLNACQALERQGVDVKALQLDLLSISGHKFYAPKGIGALFIKSGTHLRQLLYGGHHQRGFRPGTENVAGIVGLGKAAELARLSLEKDAARIVRLRDTLEQGILARVPDSHVNSANVPRTPNTTNILFPGLEGEALLIALDLKGLACSTGAACSSGAVEPSHVLTAIGLPAAEARASIRFSP